MPSLESHHSSSTTKLLLVGDSGTGKTGALCSLVLAGYSLWIMDFDNGLDIVANILARGSGKQSARPDLLAKVNAVTLTDSYRVDGNSKRVIPTSASAWPRAVALLEKWETFGPVSGFGNNDILVVDSLNFAGRAAMRHIQQLNNRLTTPPQIQDYFDGQTLMDSLCQMLYSEQVKCNVIALTHLREIGKKYDVIDDKGRVRTVEDKDSLKGFPETGTGRALSPTIGRYFNAVLMADIIGSGQGTRRLIRTQPHLNIGLKNSAPGSVKPEYPLETGLADYFKAVRGPQEIKNDKS